MTSRAAVRLLAAALVAVCLRCGGGASDPSACEDDTPPESCLQACPACVAPCDARTRADCFALCEPDFGCRCEQFCGCDGLGGGDCSDDRADTDGCSGGTSGR